MKCVNVVFVYGNDEGSNNDRLAKGVNSLCLFG